MVVGGGGWWVVVGGGVKSFSCQTQLLLCYVEIIISRERSLKIIKEGRLQDDSNQGQTFLWKLDGRTI